MIKIIKTLIVWSVFAMLCAPAFAYVTGTPVPTDSRIKTFVYNANDVYRVLTHYGYQMNIEFGDSEEIETVSVGDRTGWQITPTENRIFVRAMEDKSQTNMTVITDKRTYQFDLYSAQPGQQGWDELVYVVRFFYPPANANQFASARPAPMRQMQPMRTSYAPPPVSSVAPPSMMMRQQMAPPPPMAMVPPTLPPLAPHPMVMQQAPAMTPMPMAPQMMAPPPMAAPMMMPPMQMPQRPMVMSPPMAQPLYSPALPPVSAPPMAQPYAMSRPATRVPPVNVARKPYGMVVPPHMAVAPPPRMPHPRAPFIANQMTKDAQTLARQYPHGSYRNSILAPRTLPSLNTVSDPKRNSQYSSSYSTSPMGLPLPSTAPGGYLQF